VLCRLLIQWAIYDCVQGLMHRVEGVRLLLVLLVFNGQDHIFIILAVDGLSACDSFLSFINYKDIGGFRGKVSIN